MKRRKLTPEQEQERAERKARQKEIAREIAGMTLTERSALCPCGVQTIEGRTLSPFNSLSVADFRERIANLMREPGAPRLTNCAHPSLVREPTDRGFYPPKRKAAK